MLSTILRFIAASLLGAAEEKQVNYLAGKPEVRRPAAELRFTAFEHIENFEGLRLKAYKPKKMTFGLSAMATPGRPGRG